MNKQHFLQRLQEGLACLPRQEVQERLTFYSEMIEDRMEEGLSEEEAVAQIGDVDTILSQIIAELSPAVPKNGHASRKPQPWEIVLLVIGSPIWLSLLIAAIAILLALYVSAWSVIISLWAVFVSFLCCAVCSIPASVLFFIGGHKATAAATLGAALVCAGLSIFAFYGARAVTRLVIKLSRWSILMCKHRSKRQEVA